MATDSTEAIYDANAAGWARSERILLSDFTARPFVIEELGPLDGRHVLDLGCGEGYVARLVAAAGAASVFGVDVSSEMVANARRAIPNDSPCAMRFEAGDVATMTSYPRPTFDRAMAVFLFNYLTRAETTAVMRAVRERLAPGGRFVFTVPHPCYAFMRGTEPPFFFERGQDDYFGGVDKTFEGRIWRRDGTAVPVRSVHKTFEDYVRALTDAGFTAMPRLRELRVTDEHVAFDPAFFGPLRGYPLHVLFRVEVPA